MTRWTPETFWPMFKAVDPWSCWEWPGSRDRDGYGLAAIRQPFRIQRSHRLAWYFHTGDDPGEQMVLHACDNPPCCNPACLFLGDAAINNADMVAKGRARYLVGDEHWSHLQPERIVRGAAHYAVIDPSRARRNEAHPLARLTDIEVAAIRARHAAGGITQRVLAVEYDVSFQHISLIIRGKARKVEA